MRQQSKFKIQEEEQSSSVLQTQCFISHSRCVDFLFNWMFVQSATVVEAGDVLRKGGEFQSRCVCASGNTYPTTETKQRCVCKACMHMKPFTQEYKQAQQHRVCVCSEHALLL